jgi:hypothetical protein
MANKNTQRSYTDNIGNTRHRKMANKNTQPRDTDGISGLCILVCHLPLFYFSNVVGISRLCILVFPLPVSCISNVVGISGLCILVCHLPVSCISKDDKQVDTTQRYRQHWKYKTREEEKQEYTT